MTFAGFGRSVRIEERTRGELVAWIVVLPIVGIGLIVFCGSELVRHSDEWLWWNWLFTAGWVGCVSLVLILGLPAVAWKELRRREQARKLEDGDSGIPPDHPPT